ncbi:MULTISPECIES: hypothetical protein [Micromonospora]|uniref:Uncharacterized protein n=3 Tax=Micromonospora TaxID=1873 RepID=A0A1C4VG78_9ACTN|nr:MULTISPECIES: hypothetical protein [Micromonospora]RLP89650.1 hypothetical protein EAD89_14495 [Micromonospora sp. BL4]RLP98942.1 hypothetical protein EAD98_03245 [Micromonospora sp. CV4]SCE82755.1 hypothetical protein GA0070607_2049 [Micromonospora coriariae]SIN31421.1 hypothetical protein SAMN04489832_5245 [Micromonospora cremea]
MAQQQTSRQQQMDERNRREQDAERSRDWGDEAAQARTPEDPRAMAPRDALGRPSTGEPV